MHLWQHPNMGQPNIRYHHLHLLVLLRLPQLLRVLHLLWPMATGAPPTTTAAPSATTATLTATAATPPATTTSSWLRPTRPQHILHHLLFKLSQQDQERKASSSTRSPEAILVTLSPTSSSSIPGTAQRDLHHSLDQLGTKRACEQCVKTAWVSYRGIWPKRSIFAVPKYFYCWAFRAIHSKELLRIGNMSCETVYSWYVTGNYLMFSTTILSATPSRQAGMLHRHSSTPGEQGSLQRHESYCSF